MEGRGRGRSTRLPRGRCASFAWRVRGARRRMGRRSMGSAWAAANPFAVASNYVNGVVTSGVVKPQDLRQQFGGSVGGPVPLWPARGRSDRGSSRMDADQKPKLFYFYA